MMAYERLEWNWRGQSFGDFTYTCGDSTIPNPALKNFRIRLVPL